MKKGGIASLDNKGYNMAQRHMIDWRKLLTKEKGKVETKMMTIGD